jgi:hypothetical protein
MGVMTVTKKLPVRPEPRTPHAGGVRPLAAARPTAAPSYAAALTQATARKLLTACVAVLPLGALAGAVSACGAAQPTQPAPYYKGEPRVAEPAPSASASTAPSTTSGPPVVQPITPPAAASR